MESILGIGASISTPMMLAGFVAAAFFLVTRAIVQKNVFPSLTRNLSANIIRLIIERFFQLAMVAMILGFAGFVIGRVVPEPSGHKFSPPSPDMIKVAFESGYSVDFGPQPEVKNVVLDLKFIPRTSGFTPLSKQATLVVRKSNSTAGQRFPMTLNIEPEGVAPQVKSYASAEGLLPRQDFLELIELSPPALAKVEVEYDPDVNPGHRIFVSDEFEFSGRIIKELSK